MLADTCVLACDADSSMVALLGRTGNVLHLVVHRKQINMHVQTHTGVKSVIRCTVRIHLVVGIRT